MWVPLVIVAAKAERTAIYHTPTNGHMPQSQIVYLCYRARLCSRCISILLLDFLLGISTLGRPTFLLEIIGNRTEDCNNLMSASHRCAACLATNAMKSRQETTSCQNLHGQSRPAGIPVFRSFAKVHILLGSLDMPAGAGGSSWDYRMTSGDNERWNPLQFPCLKSVVMLLCVGSFSTQYWHPG